MRRGTGQGPGRTKSGKPRPGTGGQGRRRLEGKGPTPPASLRPGHPAQRRAAGQPHATGMDAAPGPGSGRRGSSAGPAAGAAGPAASGAGSGVRSRPAAGPAAAAPRGAGGAAEIVAGRNAVLESLRAGVPATVLYAAPRLDPDERIGEAVLLAADARIPVVEAGRAELDRLTGAAVHQGLALRVRPHAYAHPDDLIDAAAASGAAPLIVALDGVTDPRNLGAVARSAEGLGGHGVLVPGRRSAGVTAGAWKASAGALARLPVARAPNLARALAGYRRSGLFVVGLDARGDADIGSLALARSPLVLVIGSEGRGLSRLVAGQCDVVARIPVRDAAASLNAGVAAGIALYAVSSLRAVPGPS